MGKITTDATSSIYDPVVGIRLTNAPTTFRRSFGTFPLSDYTNPGWIVELYVNNVLVDYKKADASGFFEFQVPLVYGTTNIRLKFYGPWGEERAKEQSIMVPFNFLPAGEFEYAITGGMIEDGKQSIYSRGQMHYGLSKAITVGTGVEYNSSIPTGTTIPFVTLATRPFSNMLLMGEYAYGVRAKGVLSLQLPKNKQIELNYIKYVPGQKAVNYNYLEERKAILTLPIKSKNFFIYNRLTYDQIILPGTGYSTAEWLISGAGPGFNTNLTNYAMFTSNAKPYIYSNLAFSFRLPAGFTFMPQGQYEYSQNELISVRASLEKYIFKNGFLSLAYENNFKSKMQSAEFAFRYDLPWAQTGFNARQTNDQTTLTEMARGSIIVDKKSNYLGANNRVNVGKGGIVFAPFLDLNCNNKRDKGEPRAFGLNIRINGGTATKNDRDSTVRVMDLEPYTNYLVELDANTFDNVAWKIHNKTLSIVVDPNSFKFIEIPVQVVGEVSGMIMKEVNGNQEGLGRVIVNIYNPGSQLSGRTLSEQDGYYSYLGLAPGDYEVKIDTAQLKKLNLISFPEKQAINIKSSIDGDVVEGIDFTLRSSLPKAKDTTKVVPKPVEETREIDQTFLQVGAFIDKKNANRAAKSLAATIHYPVEIFFEDGWYKVRFGPFTDKNEVDLCKKAIVASKIIPEELIKEVHQTKSEKVRMQAGRSITQQNIAVVPQKEPAVPPQETVALPKAPVTQPQKPVTPPKRQAAPGREIALPRIAPSEPEGAGNVIFTEHPVTQEELTKGDNILKKHYYIQIAAFNNPKNATKLIKRITRMIPYSVGVVYREQFYKVRYGPFETQEELNNCIRLIVKAGIMQKELMRIFYEEIGSTPEADQPHLLDGFHVQVGAFRDKANATRFYKQMSAEYPFPILMIEEDGYYKVRFGPFKSESDTRKCRKAVVGKVPDSFMRSNTIKYF